MPPVCLSAPTWVGRAARLARSASVFARTHTDTFTFAGSSTSLLLNRASLPRAVRIVEVGPRDGLQNESGPSASAVTPSVRADLVARLALAGLTSIEAGAFVNPKLVPMMANTPDVIAQARAALAAAAAAAATGSPSSSSSSSSPSSSPFLPRLSVLTPNLSGFQAAVEARADEVAVFAAATDAFSRRNINCGVLDSLERFKPVLAEARRLGVPVRGYVSCVVGCPYSGPVPPSAVAFVASALYSMGCYEISLGDTIGVGTPWSVRRMLHSVVHEGHVPPAALALHAHDTYGSGLANVAAALECGITVVDASVAGLGGCPYAGGGASGNISTEDVAYMLEGMGVETGVDIDAACAAGEFICGVLQKPTRSKVSAARTARKRALRDAQEAVGQAAALAAGPERDKASAAAANKIEASKIALAWPQRPATAPAVEWEEAAREAEQAAQERDAHVNGQGNPSAPPEERAHAAAAAREAEGEAQRERAVALAAAAAAGPDAAAV
jgi:hydroxymethylglutaryl-CoA lyase